MAQAEVKAFFEGWSIYQTVIEQDYMLHSELISVLHEAVAPLIASQQATDRPAAPPSSSGKERISILDLGCGDCYVPSRALAPHWPLDYTGIDLAAPVLELARQQLSRQQLAVHHGWRTSFIAGDMLETLCTLTSCYDLVLSGFSLHHLTITDKQALLKAVRHSLAPEGHFLFYDVICQPGESRNAFIDRYMAHVRQDWTRFDSDQIMAIDGHIRQQDFPVEEQVWAHMAERAGFTGWRRLYTDPRQFYGLFLLS